jgi:hypothetical protein
LPEVRKVWKPSPVRQLQEGKVLRSEVPEGRLERSQEELQQVDREKNILMTLKFLIVFLFSLKKLFNDLS